MIAALFVATDGCYFGLPNVDPWDELRDACLYDGPWPVVAHPPCASWSRLWKSSKVGRLGLPRGTDGGCFESALISVRRFGGVLEHPDASFAFKKFSLPIPSRFGGWTGLDEFGGRSCLTYQGQYGHFARKATLLYAVSHSVLPDLNPNIPHLIRNKIGRNRGTGLTIVSNAKNANLATPIKFRDILIGIAESCIP
jgi:hypothetical protein